MTSMLKEVKEGLKLIGMFCGVGYTLFGGILLFMFGISPPKTFAWDLEFLQFIFVGGGAFSLALLMVCMLQIEDC